MLAGAGSGKTRTMVARARYAAEVLGTEPSHIAFVTFTRRAAQEIRDRTQQHMPGLEVGTIHALARKLLRIVEGRTVQLTPLANDETLRLHVFRHWLHEERAVDLDVEIAWCARRDAVHAETKDHVEHKLRIPPSGQTVKSHGEQAIGITLHEHRIPYIYEAQFPLPPRERSTGKQYAPDFYLPDTPDAQATTHGGVWLEHYAHDRDGDLPPKFENEGYQNKVEWKRRLHEKLKTRYAETCYGDIQRGRDGDGKKFEQLLLERASDAGSTAAKQALVGGTGSIAAQQSGDVATVDGGTPHANYGLPDKNPDPDEQRVAIEVDRWIQTVRQQLPGRSPIASSEEADALRVLGKRILGRWEKMLKARGQTDHEQTILDALRAAQQHSGPLPWQHVLIDEYQDVNPAQAAFVHALTAPRPDGSPAATLCAVGDDWQAIYGFQGGDANLIREFADPLGHNCGYAEHLELRNSYRFGQPLADVTRDFAADVAGSERRVTGVGPPPPKGMPAVTICTAQPVENPAEVVQKADAGKLAYDWSSAPTVATRAVCILLEHWIPRPTPSKPMRMLVMSYRNVDVGDTQHTESRMGLGHRYLERAAARFGVRIECLTIHKAKGSEADYAVLLDSGTPTAAHTAENQALQRALAVERRMPRHEEERLWYVALTRAKRAAAVVVLAPNDASPPTCRLMEMAEAASPILSSTWMSRWLALASESVPCPECQAEGRDGILKGKKNTRTGKHFHGCSQWRSDSDASCDYTQPACAWCLTGLLDIDEHAGRAACRNQDCGATVPICHCRPPKPMEKRRNSRTGEFFWGCANFSTGRGCGYSRNVDAD